MANKDRVGAIPIDSKLWEFEGRIEFSTAKAHLVEPTIGEKTWVPKSQVIEMYPVSDDGLYTFHVSEWWAVKAKELT